jgi:hypothetical protein
LTSTSTQSAPQADQKNQPWNGDVLTTSSNLGNFYSTTGYLAFDDETVTLSGGAWRNWIVRWVESGPDVSPNGMLRALNGTATEYNHDWCQRCEAFAIHDLDTPGVKKGADLDAAPNARAHLDRWLTCVAGEVDYFHDDPPERFGNIAPNCTACPPLNFADPANDGACTPCPAGKVPRGDTCEDCDDGWVPTPTNECSRCPAYEISVGGACVPCRYGEGADRATNTCVDCTPDAALDWRTVETGLCDPFTTEVSIPSVEAPDDICPGFSWFEINHLEALTALPRSLRVKPLPENFFSGLINQANRTPYSVRLRAFRTTAPGAPVAWTELAFSGDGEGDWAPCDLNLDPWCPLAGGDFCEWDTQLDFPAAVVTAVGNRIRFNASAWSGFTGPETPVRLMITGTRSESVGCEPH